MSDWDRYFFYFSITLVAIVALFAIWHNSQNDYEERIANLEERLEVLWDFQRMQLNQSCEMEDE